MIECIRVNVCEIEMCIYKSEFVCVCVCVCVCMYVCVVCVCYSLQM